MKAKKKIVRYHNEECIKNGTTTIVYGTLGVQAKGQVHETIKKVVKNGRTLLIGGHGLVKGVSRLHPEDSYDEMMGKMVASEKAEMKALKAGREILVDYAGELKAALKAVETEIGLIDERSAELRSKNH